MKRNLALPVFIILSACASEQIRWMHPTRTQEAFVGDNYRCVQESRVQWAGYGLIGLAVMPAWAQSEANRLYRLCMEAAGYQEIANQP